MSKLFKILFITVVVKQLVWIAFIPLWHFPDEQAHFGQVAFSVEFGKHKLGPNLSKEILISERILQTERDWAGNNKYTYHPEYNIKYSDSVIGPNEMEIINFPLDQRQILKTVEATRYPPLYYLPANIIYSIFYNQNLLIRVYLIRIWNIFYFGLFVVLLFKLFKIVFVDELFTLLGVSLLTYQPMFSFAMAGINSDNLFNLLSLFIIYICMLIIKDGLKIKYLLSSTLTIIAVILTKPQGYIVLSFYLFPIAYLLIKKKFQKSLLPLLILFIILILSFSVKYIKGEQFVPDVDIYNKVISNVNFIKFTKWTALHTYKEILPWYWGVFRWLSLTLPRVVNRIINRVLVVLAVGVILYIIKMIKKKDFSFKTISFGFFFYTSAVYFAIITVWDYLFTLTHGFSFGIQGRYFFPTIASHIGILAFGIVGFSSKLKIQKILAGILSGGMIILHELALFKLLFSYFSIESISKFFIQASQYKPWFFKSPVLEFIMLIHLITLLIFFYEFINRIFSHEKAVS